MPQSLYVMNAAGSSAPCSFSLSTQVQCDRKQTFTITVPRASVDKTPSQSCHGLLRLWRGAHFQRITSVPFHTSLKSRNTHIIDRSIALKYVANPAPKFASTSILRILGHGYEFHLETIWWASWCGFMSWHLEGLAQATSGNGTQVAPLVQRKSELIEFASKNRIPFWSGQSHREQGGDPMLTWVDWPSQNWLALDYEETYQTKVTPVPIKRARANRCVPCSSTQNMNRTNK